MTIHVERALVPVGDVEATVFTARPMGDGPFPAMIVVPEAFGLNANIKDIALQFAEAGYFAAAPDVYARNPVRVAAQDDVEAARKLILSLPDDQMVSDVQRVRDWLAARPDVREDAICLIGFSGGGRMAYLAGCRVQGLAAVVVFYGGRIAERTASEARPVPAIEYTKDLSTPMLGLWAEDDVTIPAEQVAEIDRELTRLGKPHVFETIPAVPHAFFCEDRRTFDAPASAYAWRRTLAFLDGVLGTAAPARHAAARPR